MAGKGRSYTFHGAFKRKEDARRKEQMMVGAYVRRVHIHGQKGGRWLVLKPTGRAKARKVRKARRW